MHLTCRRRRKVLLALTLLVACSSTVAATTTETSLAPVSQESNAAQKDVGTTPNEHPSPEQDAKALESQKALADALSIIKALDALPPHTASPIDATLPAWITSLFPNPSGPVASTLRIVAKLRSQQWLPSFLSSRASRDEARASLYYTFGAAGGDPASQMAMGYRYWAGIGVREDCMAALEWYERASHQAMSHFLSGPPGGRTLPLKPTKLSDLSGGLYGHGASVASTGYNSLRAPITAANARAAGETWDDVLEYYTYHADRQEPDFALKLAKIYYHGSIYAGEAVGKVQRDYWRAFKYFRAVARKVWIRDSLTNPTLGRKELSKDEQGVVVHAAVACAYLGKMYLRGEGVKPDARIARMWFMRGAEFGEKESHNGLGIIYRDGLLDGKQDLKKAAQYFAAAAGQDLPDAQVNYGKIYYERKDYTNAIPFFENAIRHGAPFEAYYYLADYNTQRARAGEPSSCSVAVAFHKHIAERGTWALNEGSLILPGDQDRETASTAPPGSTDASMNSAWRQLKEDGDLSFGRMGVGMAGIGEERMIRWSIESERGEEVAQNNLAFILDQDKSSLRKHHKPTNSSSTRLALQHYTRSAAQRNVDALVKVADYHFYGLGTAKDIAKAVGYYSAAVDTQVSALAMWNLGWCYEYGVGVPKGYTIAGFKDNNKLDQIKPLLHTAT
ncbi:ERAD-associated protein [Ceratobasidium sp. 423]|nr:ERAD-associated protein [Ceratobasidium sp. 423]